MRALFAWELGGNWGHLATLLPLAREMRRQEHDAQVKAEVTIDDNDIGFVTAGQKAKTKLETFSFTKYRTAPTDVPWVTADAINSELRGAIFPAALQLT